MTKKGHSEKQILRASRQAARDTKVCPTSTVARVPRKRCAISGREALGLATQNPKTRTPIG